MPCCKNNNLYSGVEKENFWLFLKKHPKFCSFFDIYGLLVGAPNLEVVWRISPFSSSLYSTSEYSDFNNLVLPGREWLQN
jgi:hypothetical protein